MHTCIYIYFIHDVEQYEQATMCTMYSMVEYTIGKKEATNKIKSI